MKVRHGLSAIACLLLIGALPALTDTLPTHCGAVGAASYTPPAYTVPAVVLNRGTVITVTNATVATNGDTSSVAALMANPGADGISLEEAIMATNHDPGTWNIQFAPALKGSTIVVDAAPGGTLSGLSGGNVTINGDINGDGQPDITLTTSQPGNTEGISVASGGNTLYALALQNFTYGVWIGAPPEDIGGTLSNITVSNLVLTDIQYMGIGAPPGSSVNQSTLDHVLITGNTITGNAAGPVLGIGFDLGGTTGATLQHSTIANNNIRIQMPGAAAGGIGMSIGGGIGSMNNQALDTLIANNAISVAPGAFGIRIGAGVGAASANLIDGVEVIGNQVQLIDQTASANGLGGGISVAVGDGASDDHFPSLRPIQYSENNIARNISILSNTIGESGNFGINAAAACCGNGNNTIDSLAIAGNTVTGVELIGGASGGYYSRPSTGNTLSNVLIQANTIHSSPLPPAPFPPTPDQEISEGGGIYVITGLGEPGNSINGISIANNDVNTQMIGINLVGGLGTQPPSAFSADNNVVSAAQIFCNQIDQLPSNGLPNPSGASGITVTAGVDAATGNQVQQLSVYDNLVAGVPGSESVFASAGSGAAGNTVSISQVSAAVNAPQFVPASVLNAATFQQGGVVPGSLVSLFGANLSGATVQFDAFSAPIIYNSSSQLNLQVPWEVQGQSSSTVTVTANSVTNAPQTVAVGSADPGVFAEGGGQGAIVNVAGILVDANSPAHAGDYLQIYATGLGAVTNTPQTGAAAVASPLSYSVSYPTATIGGVPAPVGFAGLAPGFVGLYQVNVQVPQGVAAGDSVPVMLSMGSSVSNTVTISVR